MARPDLAVARVEAALGTVGGFGEESGRQRERAGGVGEHQVVRRRAVGAVEPDALHHPDGIDREVPPAGDFRRDARRHEPVVLRVMVFGTDIHGVRVGCVPVCDFADQVVVQVAAHGERVTVFPYGRERKTVYVGRPQRGVARLPAVIRYADPCGVQRRECRAFDVAAPLRHEQPCAQGVERAADRNVWEQPEIGAAEGLRCDGGVFTAQPGRKLPPPGAVLQRGIGRADLLGVVLVVAVFGQCEPCALRLCCVAAFVRHVVAGVAQPRAQCQAVRQFARKPGVGRQDVVYGTRGGFVERVAQGSGCAGRRVVAVVAVGGVTRVVGDQFELRTQRVDLPDVIGGCGQGIPIHVLAVAAVALGLSECGAR